LCVVVSSTYLIYVICVVCVWLCPAHIGFFVLYFCLSYLRYLCCFCVVVSSTYLFYVISVVYVVVSSTYLIYVIYVVCVWWCTAHIGFLYCIFVFLRLVYSMLPVSLDCSFFDCPFGIL
jgi:hypothetical protein